MGEDKISSGGEGDTAIASGSGSVKVPNLDNLTLKDKKDDEPSELIKKIGEGDITAVQNLLRGDASHVNDRDSHNMTPLEHAAYRGNKEMCQILIDCGARVTDGQLVNGYTTLHFAALSGNASLCQFLLQNGAKPDVVNSVGRTAAQMAAFVGNHHCVSSINTYINKEDIQYFSERKGLDSTWRLPRELVNPVHNLTIQVNFHPVKIALLVKESEIIQNNMQEVIKVLPLLVEREIKKGADANEIVALKVHLIYHTLNELQKETRGAKGNDPIENFIKKMLRCDTPGGIPEGLDVLLRYGVRSFPYPETTIMQQLVTNLTYTKVCEYPGAWGVISGVINGQKGFRENDPCCSCGEEKGAKKCARCHFDAYCNKDCQKLHWFVHKKYCKSKAEELAAKANEKDEDDIEKVESTSSSKSNETTQ